MAREGLPFLVVSVALALALLVASHSVPGLIYGAGIFAIVSLFMAYFFRDPERISPA